MILVEGELWDELGVCDLLLVTTNATCRRSDGGLVMGRGAAKEAIQRFPGLDVKFGKILTACGLEGKRYGLIHAAEIWRDQAVRISCFQVKYHWSDRADLGLIAYSTERLKVIAERHPERRVAMNVPGTGNGRLPMSSVLPIIERLPHNCFVYHRGELRD